MKRNLLLVLAILIAILLGYNSAKRIMSLKGTSQEVDEAKMKLEELKKENTRLKEEFRYKQSNRFIEEEIRNKLGLAKKNEAIVVVPKKEDNKQEAEGLRPVPNWQKWRDLFLGS